MKNIREMPKDERLKEPTQEEVVTTLRVLRFIVPCPRFEVIRG